MIHRRVVLVGLCTAFGVPRRSAWPLPLMRYVYHSLQKLEDHIAASQGNRYRDIWEPSPSSFHLEVIAVLRLLEVEHAVEQKQRPYCLDLVISPAQFDKARQSLTESS